MRLFTLKDTAGPAGIALTAGTHTLRLTNLQGVHLSLDYLVLAP